MRSKAGSVPQPPPPPAAPTPSQVIDSTTSESSQSRAEQRAAEEDALLGEDEEGLDVNLSKADKELLQNSEPEEMEVVDKTKEAQHSTSNSESSSGIGYSSVPIKKKEARHSNAGDNKKTEKKEARNSGMSDGAGSRALLEVDLGPAHRPPQGEAPGRVGRPDQRLCQAR